MELGTRDKNLDFMKGFAILCVVAGHVLDGAMGKSLFPSARWMHTVYDFIYIFHMPLFFLLSGISFAKSQANKDVVRRFSRGGERTQPFTPVPDLVTHYVHVKKYLFNCCQYCI